MKIGVTGFRGKIGSRLVAMGGIPIDCDVARYQETRLAIEKVNPDVIVHCAGISDIDKCQQMEFSDVFRVNSYGTEYANVTRRPFLLLSSDHVFDGKYGKYKENDPYGQMKDMSNYALSKIGAEAMVLTKGWGKIIRLSTTFGPELTQCHRWGELVVLPAFIKRSYAYIQHIVRGIWWAANNYDKLPNVLNLAGTEVLSQYEFGLMYADVFGWDKQTIEPRMKPDKNYVNRPFKAGLNLTRAKRLGIPLYSAYEGLVQLKEDMA